ncbi:MAG TPA: glycosyltransferase family 2 protein [Ignavibacteria bacterium]|nr:glycosyltransferase family 2 protein [Ignavibacteria bacterium]
MEELHQTVKTGEKPLQDPVVTAPNEINNGTFKPAHKHNSNGKKYGKNKNHKNGSSTKIQTAVSENGTEISGINGNGKKVIVNQQTKETTQEQKPQNKKYFRKNPNQRRFFNRDRNQNQSQQLNLSGKMITVVVPLYNEEDSLVELSVALKKVLDNMRCSWEVLFIDDGSTDSSYQKLQEIHRVNSRFKCLKFKRNYGKSSALQEGFKAAKGDYVITMDADLQDDPEEIPALIAKLNEGFDLVSGWKKVRHDPFIKKHTSKIFNGVTSMMVGLKLHDYNCGLKAYVRDVVKNVKVYGEMHRYIPALAHLSGFKVTEMAVTHHERKYGKTKYGLSRFFNGLFDLITVLFTTKYIKRPLHLFGFIGVLSFIAGTGILLYLTILKFFEATPISGRPLFFVGILMAIVGVQFFSIGLIGEMITKTSVENDNVIIDKTLGLGS